MSGGEYCGHTNYATWCAHLWLTSTEPLYSALVCFLHHAVAEHPDNIEDAANELADSLREFFRENMPDSIPQPYGDLLEASVQSVDWYQIAHGEVKDEMDYRSRVTASEDEVI